MSNKDNTDKKEDKFDPSFGLEIFQSGDKIYFYDLNRAEWIRAIFSFVGYNGAWYMVCKPDGEDLQRFKMIPSMSPQKLPKSTRIN